MNRLPENSEQASGTILIPGKLFWAVMLLTVACTARLISAAVENENWKGAVISTLHVVLVAVATYFSLRRPR